jgi:hypothetical protein
MQVDLTVGLLIGVVVFAAYSQAADLTNGIAWYATLGVGTALLSLAAAITGLGDDPGTQRLVALALAAGLTLAHSLVSARAAPANLAQRRLGADERALGQLFDRFARLQTLRATLQVATLGACVICASGHHHHQHPMRTAPPAPSCCWPTAASCGSSA